MSIKIYFLHASKIFPRFSLGSDFSQEYSGNDCFYIKKELIQLVSALPKKDKTLLLSLAKKYSMSEQFFLIFFWSKDLKIIMKTTIGKLTRCHVHLSTAYFLVLLNFLNPIVIRFIITARYYYYFSSCFTYWVHILENLTSVLLPLI